MCKLKDEEIAANGYQHCFFLINLFVYFNWRLIILQYVVVFAIHRPESATGVHVSTRPEPPPNSLPTPSLWVVPEHRF